jgi:cellulose synthase/poly-beta-1,6-N-acetylglucosamine synthase-like glycosyltransferase
VAIASVIIPAHNEANTIGRSLTTLRRGMVDDDLDVVVVCNGCTDSTAAVARAADPLARVIEIDRSSKTEAMRVGAQLSTYFPRVHLDADVELSGTSLRALVEPLSEPGALATAPERHPPQAGGSVLVRWYYDVWEQLPNVRAGLFGRGVVALAERAQGRVAQHPDLLNDDLVMSDAFTGQERRVVPEAIAVIRPPRNVRDLVRRRIRVATGNVQASRAGVRRASSRTALETLARMVLRRPALVPRLAVFVAVNAVARLAARRAVRAGDFTTWQRDESSRG